MHPEATSIEFKPIIKAGPILPETSRYVGVRPRGVKWIARFMANKKAHFLGVFSTEYEAGAAYAKAVGEHGNLTEHG
jgi:hypothetical protein